MSNLMPISFTRSITSQLKFISALHSFIQGCFPLRPIRFWQNFQHKNCSSDFQLSNHIFLIILGQIHKEILILQKSRSKQIFPIMPKTCNLFSFSIQHHIKSFPIIQPYIRHQNKRYNLIFHYLSQNDKNNNTKQHHPFGFSAVKIVKYLTSNICNSQGISNLIKLSTWEL